MKEIDDYLANVDEKRQAAFRKLYEIVKDNLPVGFEENFQYNMISFVVPLSTYPKGYLNREDEPVPFISLAAQKNHIALYHMGIMGNETLLAWFEEEYQKQVPTKLNMGKSCIRMTNVKNIPYDLLGELASKMTLEEWLQSYEKYTNK
ncbi:DUF1801 domain-containing protein [Vagococcus fluvialis]|uniref:DUF1801 domain-containing protein n=1 Tax=Vagococcus fluvialis TaxID=2738 RepID=A0A7X6DBM1_9ENTE|nr:DUF1801 domain-containing protein [Vagococcus fluvialis]NKC69347.1 DUF1801 domain-containing protein [Vagococcus fluvialis]